MRLANFCTLLIRKHSPDSDSNKQELERDLLTWVDKEENHDKSWYKLYKKYDDNPFVRVALSFAFIFVSSKIHQLLNPNLQVPRDLDDWE